MGFVWGSGIVFALGEVSGKEEKGGIMDKTEKIVAGVIVAILVIAVAVWAGTTWEEETEGPAEKVGEALDEAADSTTDSLEEAGDEIEQATD